LRWRGLPPGLSCVVVIIDPSVVELLVWTGNNVETSPCLRWNRGGGLVLAWRWCDDRSAWWRRQRPRAGDM